MWRRERNECPSELNLERAAVGIAAVVAVADTTVMGDDEELEAGTDEDVAA